MIKTLDKLKHYSMTDKYYADEYGNVYFNKKTGIGNSARKKGDKVKSFLNKYGYVEYSLEDKDGNRKHIQAHRIAASLFIPQTDINKKYVNHIDGNKENNHISNLEWCTASKNEQHSYTTLQKQPWNKGKKLPSGHMYKGPIRTVYRFSLNGEFEKEYFNPTSAEKDGYNLKSISACCNGAVQSHKDKLWSYTKDIQNIKKPKRKHPGVTLRKDTNKYQAQIVYKKKKYSVGCYNTLEEAVQARNHFLENHPEIKIKKTNMESINE